jgi:hypothetical protein
MFHHFDKILALKTLRVLFIAPAKVAVLLGDGHVRQLKRKVSFVEEKYEMFSEKNFIPINQFGRSVKSTVAFVKCKEQCSGSVTF